MVFYYNFNSELLINKTNTMKTLKNLKKHLMLSMGLLLTVIVLIASGCKSGTQGRQETTDELSREIQDVQEEVNEIIAMEKVEMKNRLESTIADFNERIEELESTLEAQNKELAAEKEALLNELKAKRDTLNDRLSEIENQANEDWDDFKTELDHDLSQFGSTVQDFFQDNI